MGQFESAATHPSDGRRGSIPEDTSGGVSAGGRKVAAPQCQCGRYTMVFEKLATPTCPIFRCLKCSKLILICTKIEGPREEKRFWDHEGLIGLSLPEFVRQKLGEDAYLYGFPRAAPD